MKKKNNKLENKYTRLGLIFYIILWIDLMLEENIIEHFSDMTFVFIFLVGCQLYADQPQSDATRYFIAASSIFVAVYIYIEYFR